MFWRIRKRLLLPSSKHTHRRPAKQPKVLWKCLSRSYCLISHSWKIQMWLTEQVCHVHFLNWGEHNGRKKAGCYIRVRFFSTGFCLQVAWCFSDLYSFNSKDVTYLHGGTNQAELQLSSALLLSFTFRIPKDLCFLSPELSISLLLSANDKCKNALYRGSATNTIRRLRLFFAFQICTVTCFDGWIQGKWCPVSSTLKPCTLPLAFSDPCLASMWTSLVLLLKDKSTQLRSSWTRQHPTACSCGVWAPQRWEDCLVKVSVTHRIVSYVDGGCFLAPKLQFVTQQGLTDTEFHIFVWFMNGLTLIGKVAGGQLTGFQMQRASLCLVLLNRSVLFL